MTHSMRGGGNACRRVACEWHHADAWWPLMHALHRSHSEVEGIRGLVTLHGGNLDHVSVLRDSVVACFGTQAQSRLLVASKSIRDARRPSESDGRRNLLLRLDDATGGGTSDSEDNDASSAAAAGWPGSGRSFQIAEALSRLMPDHLADLVGFIAPVGAVPPLLPSPQQYKLTSVDSRLHTDGPQESGASGQGRQHRRTLMELQRQQSAAGPSPSLSSPSGSPATVVAVGGGLSLNITGPYPNTTLQAGSDALGLWQVGHPSGLGSGAHRGSSLRVPSFNYRGCDTILQRIIYPEKL